MKCLILIISFAFSISLSGCLEGGIKTVGSSVGSNDTKTYSWILGSWGGCSATQCGTAGTQLRIVVCRDSLGADVADSFCLANEAKPATSQSCSAAGCPVVYTYAWESGNWSACSATACGTSGTQTRTVICKRNDGQTAADTNCTATKPGTSQACSAPACSTGTAPIDILVTPAFETAGVIIKLPASVPNTASAKIFIKKQSDTQYKEAHPFTRYDANNMATSLFGLQSNTTYNIEVQYTNGTTTVKTASFNTRVDDGVQLPAAIRTVNVANTAQLQAAINSMQAGDSIVMANGVYGAISISGKKGTAASPVVIRGGTAFDHMNPPANSNRAIIDGGANVVYFENSSNIILHNVEVRNGTSSAVYLRNSSKITIQNSYIHDGGTYNFLISKGTEYTTDVNQAGYHLIQNNHITDTTGFANCTGAGYNGCSGITYYGIQINNNGGAGNIIRGNKVYGHVDNITTCGDETEGRNLSETTAHVLRLTSTSGTWLNHDTEVYDNQAYGGLDDDIEMDGICVNLRVYRNRLGKASETNVRNISAHPITIAPVMPGPIFILRNVIENYEESAFKMNTGGTSTIPIRNIYVYHNTFIKQLNLVAIMNLWYALPGDHNVPVKNIQIKNNIFYAPNGAKATDAYNQGTEHPTFNYNLWYTSTSSSSLFEWYNGSNKSAADIAGFRTISGQEVNGLFGQPNLTSTFGLNSSSPAIDKALVIPGINDVYSGAQPDMGALEY